VGMRRIIRAFEILLGPLSKSLLLEYPSVDALASHLVTRHAARLADKLPAAEPSGCEPVPAAAPATPVVQAAGPAEDIAIIGFSGRYAGAPDVDTFWDNLAAGRDSTGAVPPERWDAEAFFDPDPAQAAQGRIYCRRGGFLTDVDRFDPLMFELTPAEARTMHPEERLLLESAWTTLDSAGYPRAAVRGRRIGVFIGANALTYPLLGLDAWRESGNLALDSSYYGLANRISYFFDLRGPSLAVDTGCSASLVAIQQACESLRSGGCEAALVGGVNLYLHPSKYWLLCHQRLATTQDAFRLFRQEGDGTVPGEGVGSLLLKPLSRALADGDVIHGVIKGSAVAYKGRSNGFLAPAPGSQAALFRDVLASAGIDAASVSYLELQSAGAEMADAAEWQALREVYGQGQSVRSALGSLKPNVGHLEAATGIAQVIKVLMQLRHGRIPPALVASERNADVRIEDTPFQLPAHPIDWTGPNRCAAITASAAGGTVAHLILQDHLPPGPLAEVPPARGGQEVVVLSARTEQGLQAMAMALRDHLAAGRHRWGEGRTGTLACVAHTLQTRRARFSHRLAVVVADEAGLIEALDGCLSGAGGSLVFTGRAATPVAMALPPADARAAAQAWVAGADIDWSRLTGRPTGAGLPTAWLPSYPFERRRCWLYDGETNMTPNGNPPGAEAPGQPPQVDQTVDASAYVANYYNRMTESMKAQTLSVEDEMYILFAPFPERVPGFSWLKAFFDPSEGRHHLDLMLAKQKELKAALYRHVDFQRVRRVFDIGCGLATDLIQLARAHPQLTGEGFTITPKQAEAGLERIARAGLADRLTVHCADSTKRPFPGRYDLIIGFEVIFHIENKQAVFANIAEHLADDGYLILADGVTNTVTEVDMPHLGQFTSTGPQFARVLADNGLLIEDCVDSSREIGNFLHDADFETHLAEINARYPALADVAEEHRCWDSFGKTLSLGVIRYLLFTIRKAPAGWHADELARRNEARMAGATPYADVAPTLPAVAPPPEPASAAQATASTERWLTGVAAEVWEMEPEAIPATARFTDYGVGSLQGLLLLERVNRQRGLTLKMPTLYDHSSIRDLARHIDRVSGGMPSAAVPPRVPAPLPAPVVALRAPAAAQARVAPAPERAPAPASASAAMSACARPAPDEPLAVVGMAARYPGADNITGFWRNLVSGTDAVTPLAAERAGRAADAGFLAGQVADVEGFDADFFRISRREAELMDPQQRLFLETCWTAFEDAGYADSRLDGERCGVFAGVMGSDYRSLLEAAGAAPEAQMLLGTDDAILAARIAYHLNLKGPALTVKTACSSSLVAVHLAGQSLRSGECDMALAGGVTLYLDGRQFEMMRRAGMLSPTGRSRPFDDDADGIAVGDGVGVVVLKRLSDALAAGDRIYGVIRGSAVNQDGRTNGITAPSKNAQKALALDLLNRSGIHPDSISYVEAHGTGTPLGDPIEVAALTEAFQTFTARRAYCAIGSVKGNIGHATAAAGVAGLIKVLLSMQHGILPASLHMRSPNRHIAFEDSPFFVNSDLRVWSRSGDVPRRAIVSAFGFSGTNSQVLVEEAPATVAPAPEQGADHPQLVVLSARGAETLARCVRQLIERLSGPGGGELSLADVAYTLQTGRSAQAERLAIVANDKRHLLKSLRACLDGVADPSLHRGTVSDTAPDGAGVVADAAWPPAEVHLQALAQAWVSGRTVEWSRLHGPRAPRRVSLPTYPFARERFWIPAPDGAPHAEPRPSATASSAASEPAWRDARLALFRPVWQTLEGSQALRPEGGTLVIDRSDRLRRALQADGWQDVRLVMRGDVFAHHGDGLFSVRPGHDGDGRALVAALQEAGWQPRTVVHVGPSDSGPEGAEAALDEVLTLVRTMLAAQWPEPVQLVHLETAPQAAGSPLASAVAGLARALAHETDRLRVQALTVEQEALCAAALRAALANGTAQLDWRAGGLRGVELQALEPTPAQASGDSALREGGVYLVTGGAGGLGRKLALALVRSRRARIVLAGRSALTPATAACLQEIEALGGVGVYVQADIADRSAVERLVAETRSRFGVIDGVIHAAGILDDGLLDGKSAQRSAAVLAPKVRGTLNLDWATRGDGLDLFLLVSSIAAVTGNVGQADYACANGFLDGFAEWRQRARPGRTLSINWPLWAEGGMGVSPDGERLLRITLGLEPMPTEAGLAAWRDLLAGDHGPRGVVAYGDPSAFLRAARGGPAAAATTGGAGTAPAQDLSAATLAFLRRFFADHLRTTVGRIDPDARFESIGIDSLMIHSFNARMAQEIGPFPRTVLFDHKTLRELTAFFVTHHAAQLANRLSPASAVGLPVPAVEPATSRAASAPAPAPARAEDIAIIGISGRYPQAPDLDTFWSNLQAGRDAVTELPVERWPGVDLPQEIYCRVGGYLEAVDRFDPLFFGIAPRDAERMDPRERLMLETAWATFEDAAYPPSRLARERSALGREVGVFVGATGDTYALWGPSLWQRGETTIPESMPWSIANRISYVFDLHGPSMPVDTACSSSLSALHLACESLRKGECAMALVGGVNLYLHPAKLAQLCQLTMLSRRGRCHSFGADGDGFVPGEGVGAVLLKPLSSALADGDAIHAVIKGSAVNHGGRTNGYTVPSARSQAELVRAALRAAGVDPAGIGYVEAHGTGTALGDPVEVAGLAAAFAGVQGARCALGSVKTQIGHLESAAGIAGLTKLVLQLKHRRLVPSLHAAQLNPAIDFAGTPFHVQRDAADWLAAPGLGEPRRAGLSSFGAGGANAHVIVEEAPVLAPAARRQGLHLFLLSARTADRLTALAARLRGFLEGAGRHLAADAVAYTLAVGREPQPERLAIVAADLGELCRELAAVEAGRPGRFQGRVPTASAQRREVSPQRLDELLAETDLAALAQLWVGGAAVEGERLWSGPRPRPVSLPGYPFAGGRHWVGEAPPAPSSAGSPDTLPQAAASGEPVPPRSGGIDLDLKTLLQRVQRGDIALGQAQQALKRRA